MHQLFLTVFSLPLALLLHGANLFMFLTVSISNG